MLVKLFRKPEKSPAAGFVPHYVIPQPVSSLSCKARWLLEKTGVSHLMCFAAGHLGVRCQPANQSGLSSILASALYSKA